MGQRSTGRQNVHGVGHEKAAERKTSVIGLQETSGKVFTKASAWVTKAIVTDMILDHFESPAVPVTDVSPIYQKVDQK